MSNLLPNVKIDLLTAATAAGTTTITSGIVDMAGWDGVIFVTTIQTPAANNIAKLQQGEASNLSDAADLAGSAQTSGTSDEGIILGVHRPLERYVRMSIARGTSTPLGEIWAIRYNGRTAPQTNSLSGTQAAKHLVSPTEGTA
ncbi:MAG: hypothetical protein ACK4WH_00925 [Phycisphaerales bacterium]